jgi:hypothetical protein
MTALVKSVNFSACFGKRAEKKLQLNFFIFLFDKTSLKRKWQNRLAGTRPEIRHTLDPASKENIFGLEKER